MSQSTEAPEVITTQPLVRDSTIPPNEDVNQINTDDGFSQFKPRKNNPPPNNPETEIKSETGWFCGVCNVETLDCILDCGDCCSECCIICCSVGCCGNSPSAGDGLNNDDCNCCLDCCGGTADCCDGCSD